MYQGDMVLVSDTWSSQASYHYYNYYNMLVKASMYA